MLFIRKVCFKLSTELYSQQIGLKWILARGYGAMLGNSLRSEDIIRLRTLPLRSLRRCVDKISVPAYFFTYFIFGNSP